MFGCPRHLALCVLRLEKPLHLLSLAGMALDPSSQTPLDSTSPGALGESTVFVLGLLLAFCRCPLFPQGVLSLRTDCSRCLCREPPFLAVSPGLEMPSEISRHGNVTLLPRYRVAFAGLLPEAPSFFSSPSLVNEGHIRGARGDAGTLSRGVCRSCRPMQPAIIFYSNVLLKRSVDVSLLTFTCRQP